MSNPNPKSEFEEAMEEFEKSIENKAKKIALLDFKAELLDAKIENYIIPDLVLEMLNNEIKNYE